MNAYKRRIAAAAALVLVLAPACASSSAPPPPPGSEDGGACALTITLGRLDAAGFSRLDEGDDVDVILGFQGFRFVDLAARFEGTSATSAALKIQATIEGRSPQTQAQGLRLSTDAGGARLADHVQIFFNDVPEAELFDRAVALALHATAEGCGADQALALTLRDGGTCADIVDAGGSTLDGGGPCVDAGH